MAVNVTTEELTKHVLACAAEQKYTYAKLLDEVCSRTNFKFPQKLSGILSALKFAGVIQEADDSKGDIIIPGTGKFAESFKSSGGGFSESGGYAKMKDEMKKEADGLREKLKQAIQAAEDGIRAANDRADANEKKIRKELDEAKSNTRILEVQVKDGTKKIRAIKAMFHREFEHILQLAKARKNIFLYGSTGCGKTHVCQQVAEALNLPFYFVSCTAGMSEGTLAGRLLPVGKSGTFEYVIGEFVKAYEDGGVFLLDEIDAADPNVLLLVNSALANGRIAIPNRPSKPYAVRHKNFICIAAANTVGTGADRMYSGRNKLDHATLDRFAIGKVFMDYDPNLENELCPDEELRGKLLHYREKIRSNRLERSMSTRFLKDAYDMKEVGWTIEQIEAAYFLGWREDEKNKAKGGMSANFQNAKR